MISAERKGPHMLRMGVDLGGTKIAAGAVDENNKIVGFFEAPTQPERSVNDVARSIVECIRMAAAQAEVDISCFAGIGIGCPGTCDAPAGVVVKAPNLGWRDVEISKLVGEMLLLPCRISNDADCAVLGETLCGASRGMTEVIMVTLGTGLGCGIILGGKLFVGQGGFGGEAGHMCIAMDGEPCSCGNRGCWEAYASGTALVRLARKAAVSSPSSLLASTGTLSGFEVFSAYDGGDEAAAGVIEEYCRYVGVGTTNLINIFRPQAVVIGGGIGSRFDVIGPKVEKYIRKNVFGDGKRHLPEILPASLGKNAGIIGAASLFGDLQM